MADTAFDKYCVLFVQRMLLAAYCSFFTVILIISAFLPGTTSEGVITILGTDLSAKLRENNLVLEYIICDSPNFSENKIKTI